MNAKILELFAADVSMTMIMNPSSQLDSSCCTLQFDPIFLLCCCPVDVSGKKTGNFALLTFPSTFFVLFIYFFYFFIAGFVCGSRHGELGVIVTTRRARLVVADYSAPDLQF